MLFDSKLRRQREKKIDKIKIVECYNKRRKPKNEKREMEPV